MFRPLARWMRFYGAGPLHLVIVLGCFALTGYVVFQLLAEPLLVRIVIWFAAAIILHDLVLFPLYALADRVLTGAHRGARNTTGPLVSPVNYIRVPVLATGLLLLLFLPGIIRQGAPTYLAATGQTQEPFLSRWLLITVGLFAASTLLYCVRLCYAHRQAKRQTGLTNEHETEH
ncbi:hypothetical protein [Saccharopolyspora phatthalungensis]|uniref:Lipoprotein n=1 Tax=Saccharopolyspora phatthalungensis TaxID=664693 RepID=A0A840QF83_9PSEU|nr:hypothetical protein [Saccharopolyspora phatthalungensis]MBB5157145.1 hypothetical protein [Saccharopolyspora phatthalungensis]